MNLKYIKLYENANITPKDIVKKVIKASSSDINKYKEVAKKAAKTIDELYIGLSTPLEFTAKLLKWKIGTYVYLDESKLKEKYGMLADDKNGMLKHWKKELETTDPELYRINSANKFRWGTVSALVRIYDLLPMLWPKHNFNSLKPHMDKIKNDGIYNKVVSDVEYIKLSDNEKVSINKNYIDKYFNELFSILSK